MKILCWLFGHTTGNKLGGACHRCGDLWISGKSLPDLWRDFQCWWPCWFWGHDWNLHNAVCAKCDVTEEMVEDGVAGRTLLDQLARIFPARSSYVPGSNTREDSQRNLWLNWYVTIFGLRFGYQWSPLLINDKRYMDRHILFLGWINLRLHKFYRGDDDSASHTHPWWFITFPFSPYREAIYRCGRRLGTQVVASWRLHFRHASHEHIVIGRVKIEDRETGILAWYHDERPFWTFVIGGTKAATWGFYPRPGKFVPWWDYKPGERT